MWMLSSQAHRPCPHLWHYMNKQLPFELEAQAAAEKLFSIAGALVPPDDENLFGQWSIADTDWALMLNRLVRN